MHAGQVFSEVISSVEHSGAKFSALYVSDPFKAIRYPSERDLQRFLAEGPSGSKLLNSTSCDEVCRLKASLLEGLFVVRFFFPFAVIPPASVVGLLFVYQLFSGSYGEISYTTVIIHCLLNDLEL